MFFKTANKNMQQDLGLIKHIVELTLGQKIQASYDHITCELLPIPEDNELDLIKHYINNKHLITRDLIAQLVDKHHSMFATQQATYIPATSWDKYLLKLEAALAQVECRVAQNFALNDRMPSQLELLHLQQNCLDLTQQWYGQGNGNISCFYRYYILMSQIAGVTRFEYLLMQKFVSDDHYVSIINRDMRRLAYQHFEIEQKEFLAQGGRKPQGRSEIDATDISNFLYYKDAQKLLFFEYAQNIMLNELGLENYGQVDYSMRSTLWNLLLQHFPENPQDKTSIYWNFIEFCNERPGEYFNYFSNDLSEAAAVPQELLQDIIKIAGLQSGRLYMLQRMTTDNLLLKRKLSLHWRRRYPLNLIDNDGKIVNVRPANVDEAARILPNELPYSLGHGLSLCGNGVVDYTKYSDTTTFEWNNPVDPSSNIDNWPRDIEKIFREFKFINPRVDLKNILLGERICHIFQNGMAYSTIHTTQHTHFGTDPIESFLIYCLNATAIYDMPQLKCKIELVQVGTHVDALYVRAVFNEIENEELLQFLINLHESMFMYFGGCKSMDLHLHLFANESGQLFFIIEPHAFLLQLDHDQFKNPFTGVITPRKPQFVNPAGNVVALNNELRDGLSFCRNFFDTTYLPGAHKFIVNFLDQYFQQ